MKKEKEKNIYEWIMQQ